MKKFTLFINFTFLTVLAFLSAGIMVTTQRGYATPLYSSSEIRSVNICGSFVRASANAKAPHIDNPAATQGTNAGNGCLHQSGFGVLCIIPGDKRRGLTKC